MSKDIRDMIEDLQFHLDEIHTAMSERRDALIDFCEELGSAIGHLDDALEILAKKKTLINLDQ